MLIALVSTKGGTSKSTLTVALGWDLLRRRKRVLLVDADVQGSVRTAGEVASEQGKPAPTIVAMGKDMHRPDQLPSLAQNFDYVLIDTPGRLDDTTRSALMVADLALLPVGQSPVEAWGVSETVELVKKAQQLRPELKVAFVITRVLPRTTLGQKVREILSESGFPILKSQTTYRVVWQESLAAGAGPSVYSPKDRAAEETRALADELLAFEKAQRKVKHG